MKVIIAGSRTILDYGVVAAAIESSHFNITEVVSGKAVGVDTFGEDWAKVNNIPIKDKPADWNKYGRLEAGYIRNVEMADYADALIAVWNGHSGGTKHMIQCMRSRKKPFFIVNISDPEYNNGTSSLYDWMVE